MDNQFTLAIEGSISALLEQKKDSPSLFDRISHRYDFLNHLLSLGLDFYWRRRAVEELPEDGDLTVLDLAAGTGDLTLAILRNRVNARQVVGVDPAWKMLELGREKFEKEGLIEKTIQIKGDGLTLPFQDMCFDAALIAFGIRNMADVNACLRELYRVLNSGGMLIILEFSLPENPLLRFIYLLYFRYLLPVIGGLISGNFRAYRYLNRTVEDFPSGEGFCDYLRQAGFESVRYRTLTRGICAIYVGVRP